MSTKTIFKRIALVAVAALGLGVLSVGPSSAAITEETLTVSAATATTSVDETATVTVTSAFIASLTYNATGGSDSRIISAVVSGPVLQVPNLGRLQILRTLELSMDSPP